MYAPLVHDHDGVYALASHTHVMTDVTDITVFGRSLIDDTDAATARATLGLGTIATEAETAYVLLAGRATPQQIAFGTASGATAGFLTSTSHATKGSYSLNAAGTIVVDEANTRLGIGRVPTVAPLEVQGVLNVYLGAVNDGRVSFATPGGAIGMAFFAESSSNERADLRRTTTDFRILTSSSSTQPGATNGIVIANNGNVGFFTDAPGASIDTAGNIRVRGASAVATFTSAGNLALKNVNDQPFISYHLEDGTRLGYLQYIAGSEFRMVSSETGSDLGLYTNNNRRVHVTSAGLVGIVATPNTARVTILAASGEGVRIIGSGASGDTSIGFITFFDSNTSTRRGFVGDASASNDDIYVRADTGALRLGASGADVVFIENGLTGFGTTAPQGLIHGHNGTGGFLHVTKTGVAGTAVTIIPDGTGDVTQRLFCMYTFMGSGGALMSGTVTVAVGADPTFTPDATNIVNLRVNANGSVDVRRTGGSQTYTVMLWLIWV